MMWWWVALAAAGELRPVYDGDTVESIAASLGDPELAASIRGLNQIAPAGQPEVGALLLLPPPAAVEQVDQRATLVSIVNEVRLARPGGNAEATTLLDEVPVGARLCTGQRSYATLMLAAACEGGGELVDEVTLMEETCIELRSVVASSYGRSSVVKVLRGSVVVGDPQSATSDVPSRVVVEAGTGVVSGVGSYRAHLEPDRALRTEALFQPVSVMGEGVQLDLQAGQGSRVPEGGEPTTPVDLLVGGPLLSPQDGDPLRRPAFTWRADEDAFGYQLSIAGDERFTKVLYVEPTPEPGHFAELLFLPLTSGEGLFWRVATLDRFGFLGVPSATRSLRVPREPASEEP